MAVLDRVARIEIDAERRARERELDVVHRQRVARQQQIDVSEANQLAEIPGAAGVDHDRPGHERDPPALRPRLPHQAGDAADRGLDPPLRRHFIAHEAERRPIARLHVRHDAHAMHPGDDQIALADVAQLAAGCGAVLHHDRRVHALPPDAHPAAVEMNVGLVVGRRIKIVRRGRVDVGGAQLRIRCAMHVAAVRRQLLQQVVERRLCVGLDGDGQVRDVLIGAADVEALDLVGAAMLDDGREDALKIAGVDQVATRVDRF